MTLDASPSLLPPEDDDDDEIDDLDDEDEEEEVDEDEEDEDEEETWQVTAPARRRPSRRLDLPS